MIDLKFIEFYIKSKYNKSTEDYFFVKRSTVSNWRKRGMPERYFSIFKSIEKSDNILELISKIYNIE